MKKTKFHKLSIILFLIIFSNFFSQKLEIKKIKKQGKREIQFFEFTFEKEKIKSKKNIVEEITLF